MKAMGVKGRKIERRLILGKEGINKKNPRQGENKIYFKIQEEI